MPWDPGADLVEGAAAKASLFNDKYDSIAAYTDGIPIADLADGTYGAATVAAGLFGLRVSGARASGDLTLTTSAADVPGATLTASSDGNFLVLGVFDFDVQSAAVAFAETLAVGTCVVDTSTQAGSAQLKARSVTTGAAVGGSRATVMQWWIVSATSGQVIKLRASRTDTGGTGFAVAHGSHTAIAVLRTSG